MITSYFLLAFLVSQMKGIQYKVLIGLSAFSTGRLYWIDSSAVDYTQWSANQPRSPNQSSFVSPQLTHLCYAIRHIIVIAISFAYTLLIIIYVRLKEKNEINLNLNLLSVNLRHYYVILLKYWYRFHIISLWWKSITIQVLHHSPLFMLYHLDVWQW